MRRALWVFSSVQYLPHVCDPFYISMRHELTENYGAEFLFFYTANFPSHCHAALHTLSDDNAHYELIISEFMMLSVAADDLLISLNTWHPLLAWGQLNQAYPFLSVALWEVYRSSDRLPELSGTSKVGKRFFTSRRGRKGEKKEEKQVAVAHNERTATGTCDEHEVWKLRQYILADVATKDCDTGGMQLAQLTGRANRSNLKTVVKLTNKCCK